MAERRRTAPGTESFGSGVHLLIVEARFYDRIADLLLEGATAACRSLDVRFEVLTVPGALELAPAIAIACESAAGHGRAYDGAVALGCVIRGETYHFEIVSNESARGLAELAIGSRLPIGNGVLTVEDELQALMRADPAQGDKGGDAVRAALSLVAIKRREEAL
ncbi:MAG TPA: 6,7-dimethyl-8-ribityllumazine synthase [Beijerinckiaceae bacterium]|nr:6,7-dimethyl-8-ribityllumazine synthase [Beijerinckiaceae bacterium]